MNEWRMNDSVHTGLTNKIGNWIASKSKRSTKKEKKEYQEGEEEEKQQQKKNNNLTCLVSKSYF